jgi:hypothetical protein
MPNRSSLLALATLRRLVAPQALLAAGLISLSLSTQAAASYVYDVSFSGPDDAGTSPLAGTVSVSGTITVDQLGTLTLSDIIDFSLTFTSAHYATNTITPANGTDSANTFGTFTLDATASELTLSLPLSSGPLGQFDITDDSHGDDLGFHSGQGFSPTETISNDPGGSLNLYDVYGATLTNGDTIILGTAATATTPVPEPSSIMLLATGSIIGVVLRRRRSVSTHGC